MLMVNFHEYSIRDKEEANRLLLDSHQTTVWTALPCIISSYNNVAITVECVPTVQGIVTAEDGTLSLVNLPKLVDVPVCFPRGGPFTLTFPIAAGDECLVIFSSRCIDGWWQAGGIAPPTDLRMHDLSDGFAIVGPFSQATKIANVSTSYCQLRNTDGKVFVDLNDTIKQVRLYTEGVQVVCDGKNNAITIVAPVVTIQASTALNITAPEVNMSGNLNVVGEVLRGQGTGYPVNLGGHVHLDAGGTGNSGPPAAGT